MLSPLGTPCMLGAQHRAVVATTPCSCSCRTPGKAAAGMQTRAGAGFQAIHTTSLGSQTPYSLDRVQQQTACPPRAAAARPTSFRTTATAPAAAAAATAARGALAPEYSADVAADEWSRRPVPVVARLITVATVFGSWWFRSALHRDRQKAAAEMRRVLVELGPAFVKIGQALASRPDVLPPEYITELELLQDRIPPFSNDEALQVIEEELGLPWTEVFSSLSPCPVAAASLGQVYRGRLASNGAEVAVKVQRPGVVEAIGRDTYILRNLAAVARQRAKLNTDLPALVDEWASSLFKELDYRREAANAIRFAQLFSFMPEVVVPKMYTEWTTTRVLVMEWIEGERLRSASRTAPIAAESGHRGAGSSSSSSSLANGEVAARHQLVQQHLSSPEQIAEDLRLVDIGVRCSLEQMLEEGFFHADPHPGNLLKTLDGRLAYIDFGMCGTIEPSVRQALIRATLHLVNREFERLAEDFVALGLLPRGANMDEVIPALTGVFQTALAGGVSNISFSTLSADLGRTMYRYSFRLPPYYTLLVRSLSVLEGIALASDPNYKVLGAAYPWVSRRLLLTTNSPELTATLDNLLYDSQGRFNFDRLESLLEQAAKARVEAQSRAALPAPPSAASSSSRQWPAGAAAAAVDVPAGQQQQQPGLLASVAAAVGAALAGPEGSELMLSSLQLLSGSNGGGWQQQVSGRGSTAAAAGGPLALVLSPEGRHIRGILEDELAKGLDAAWRLNLDRTFDAASGRFEGALSFAANTPWGRTPMVQWLQQQAQAAAAARSSSSSEGVGHDGVLVGNGRNNPSDSSSSSSGRVEGVSQPDLVESLLNLPRLAGEDDQAQIDGLQRLAVQLAAFSSPPPSSSNSSSSTSSLQQQGSLQQQHQQQQLTQQQVANAAALQQVRQAALVLRWFVSEVQLLSPEAQREALAIPSRILSKLGSRLAARAVRAVLTPASGNTLTAGSPSNVVRSTAGTGAVQPSGPVTVTRGAAGVMSSPQTSNSKAGAAVGSSNGVSSSGGGSGSNGSRRAVGRPAVGSPPSMQTLGELRPSSTAEPARPGSRADSSSSQGNGRAAPSYSSPGNRGSSTTGSSSNSTPRPVSRARGRVVVVPGQQLSNSGKGGRMLVLSEPAAAAPPEVQEPAAPVMEVGSR